MNDENNNLNKEPAVSVVKKAVRFPKPLIICAAILLALVLIGSVAYAALAHFILFPNFASALGNTLESKLDIGTEFRIDKLIDGGKITLEAGNMDGDTENASFSLSYDAKGYIASAVLDSYEIDIAMTDKGMAYSSNKLHSGKSYGISFENIEESLTNSALYYENDGDYALTKDEFKAKLKTLEALAEDSERIKKDLFILYSEFSTVLEDSTLSEYGVAYGGIKLNGETRKARAQIYSFDTNDIIKFLSDAAERFEDPSAKVEDAVERLAKTEAAGLIGDYLGYRVSDCDDLARLLRKLAHSLKANYDGAHFDLVIGYVGRAVSVIQLKISDGTALNTVTADFGAGPTRERKIDITAESAVGNEKSKIYLGYDLTETETGTSAKIKFDSYVYSDAKKGYYRMDGKEICIDFDNGKRELAFVMSTVEERYAKELEKPMVRKNTDAEILFACSDRSGELALELRKVTEDGKEVTPTGDYRIIIATKPDALKLPKYEKVFNMSQQEYEDYRGEVERFLEDLEADEADGMEMIPEDFDLSKYFK